MSQSYKKSCTYCKQEILMSETLGKWFPLNLDNSPHVCEGKNRANSSKTSTENRSTQEEEKEKQPQLKTLLEMTLLVQQMDERLRRVERIVVDPRK